MSAATDPKPAPSKARKLLRKSLTGSILGLVVAGLLVWTNRSANGEPILYASAVLLLGAIWEATRMGSLATRDLFPALAIPVAWAIVTLMEEVPSSPHAATPKLVAAYALCGSLAACSYALGHVWTAGRGLTRIVVYGLGAWAVLQFGDVRDAGPFVFAVLGAIAIGILVFRPNGRRGLAIATGLAVWIVPPLFALRQIWSAWSTSGLVAFLLCAKIGDTAGYYVGTAFGRHHPFPTISPGKTVEGCIGSFAAGIAAGGIAVSTGLLPGRLVAGLAAGGLVNLAAQAGDLVESWVKRKAGVKDSSSVFGPSGGLLDQLDSILLAVPVALLAWPWILDVPPGSH